MVAGSNDEVRKKRVGKACDSCRMKKTKCDGRRPCLRCSQDDKLCTYSEKRRQQEKTYSASYVELLEIRVEILQEGLQKVISKIANGEDVSSFVPANGDFSINSIIEVLNENNITGTTSGAGAGGTGLSSSGTTPPSDDGADVDGWNSQSNLQQNAYGHMNYTGSGRSQSQAPVYGSSGGGGGSQARASSVSATVGQRSQSIHGHSHRQSLNLNSYGLRSSSAGPDRRRNGASAVSARGLHKSTNGARNSRNGHTEYTRGRQRVDYYESDNEETPSVVGDGGDSDDDVEDSGNQGDIEIGGLGLAQEPVPVMQQSNGFGGKSSLNSSLVANFDSTTDEYSPAFKVSPFSDQTSTTTPPSAALYDYGNESMKLNSNGATVTGAQLQVPSTQPQPQPQQPQATGPVSPNSGTHFAGMTGYLPQYDTRQSFEGMLPVATNGSIGVGTLSDSTDPRFNLYDGSSTVIGGNIDEGLSALGPTDFSQGAATFNIAPPPLLGGAASSSEPSSVMGPSEIGFRAPFDSTTASGEANTDSNVAGMHNTAMPFDYERADFGMDMLSLGPYKSAASLATAAISGEYDPSDLVRQSRRASEASAWGTISPRELMTSPGHGHGHGPSNLTSPEPLDLDMMAQVVASNTNSNTNSNSNNNSHSRKASFSAISRGIDEMNINSPAGFSNPNSPTNASSGGSGTVSASSTTTTGSATGGAGSGPGSSGKIQKNSAGHHHHHHFHSTTPGQGPPYYYPRGESASRLRDRSRSKVAVRTPRASISGEAGTAAGDRGRSTSKPPFGGWTPASEDENLMIME